MPLSSTFQRRFANIQDDDDYDRIEDDQTAGSRGVTPQSPTTEPQPQPLRSSAGITPPVPIAIKQQIPEAIGGWSPGPSAIQGSMDRGQTTQLSDRIQKPMNPLEQRISDRRAEMARLGTSETPQTLGDTVLPGGGVGRGIGRFLINAVGGGVGQGRRNQEFQNTLAQRVAAQQAIEADTRQLSQEQESENRLREQEEFQRGLWGQRGQQASSLEAQKEQGRVGLEGVKQEGRTALETQREQFGQKKLDQQYREFQTTDQYRRWKAQLDNSTKLHIAQLQQSKAPAALMQTAVFADGGIKSLNDAEAAMQKLEQTGVMGQSWAQNKVEDWIFGKGAVDPSLSPEIRKTIGELRTSLNLAASAMTRAHTQRGSKEVYDDLKNRLGPNQDWAALRGAISESQDMLGQYVMAASDANISRIRSGAGPTNTPQQTPAQPQQGGRVTLDQLKKERRQPGF